MGLILVTGAAGFIGSNVARAFCAAGHDVVGCDNLRKADKWRNLLGTALHDLIIPEALPDWLTSNAGKVQVVIHLGAVSATTETDVDRIVRDNIRLSLDLWAWCTQYATPFLYASSAATYGDGSHGFDDKQTLSQLNGLRPLNAYGWSKQMIDCRIMSDVTSRRPIPPQWAGLKFFNVYGPGEDHKGEMRSVVNKIIPLVRRKEVVKLFKSHRADYADGGQMRDFVYVDDVVAVIQWLVANPAISGLFNVGSGVARSWSDLAQIVFSCIGLPPNIEYIDMPPHLRSQYQYFTEAPIQKLRSVGWNADTTSLEKGIAKYVAASGCASGTNA